MKIPRTSDEYSVSIFTKKIKYNKNNFVYFKLYNTKKIF